MNAFELMLKNWVIVDNEYVQVTDLDGYKNEIEVEATFNNRTCEPYKENDNRIKPVPLTEDILVANGWDHIKRYRCDIYSLTKQIASAEGRKTGMRTQKVEFYKAADGREMTKCYVRGYERNLEGVIHYVHELQNALSACGLYEMADTFKIR